MQFHLSEQFWAHRVRKEAFSRDRELRFMATNRCEFPLHLYRSLAKERGTLSERCAPSVNLITPNGQARERFEKLFVKIVCQEAQRPVIRMRVLD